MSITKVKGKSAKRTKWDEAISDAKKKIKALQFTIAVYKQRKKEREPWPG
jgi:hypothetical protein